MTWAEARPTWNQDTEMDQRCASTGNSAEFVQTLVIKLAGP